MWPRYLTAVLAPIIVIGLLTVGVLWYYGGFDSPPPVAATTTPPQSSPCPDDPGVRQAVTPNHLTAGSDPYVGPGPHPVEVVPVNRGGPGSPYWDTTALRPEWEVAAHEDQRPQLVLCQYATRLETAAGVCEYDISWTPHVPERRWPGAPSTSRPPPDHRLAAEHARYSYRLYAIQTGELLTEMEADGAHCPGLIDIVRGNEPVSVLLAPDRSVEPLIAPFVEAAR